MSPQTDQASYSWVADYAPLIVLLVLVVAGVLMLRFYKQVPRKPGDGFEWSTFFTGDAGSSSSSDPNAHHGNHHAGSHHSSNGFDAGGHHGGGFDGGSHGGGFDGGGGHH